MTSEREELKCMDRHAGGCRGAVEYRMNLAGTGLNTVRCDLHWGKRLDLEEEITRKYGTHSSVPPSDFDPSYAGEEW